MATSDSLGEELKMASTMTAIRGTQKLPGLREATSAPTPLQQALEALSAEQLPALLRLVTVTVTREHSGFCS